MNSPTSKGVRPSRLILATAVGILTAIAGDALAAASADDPAARILRATGVRGGAIVHVGCGDGRLTAALRANDSYLVQGLDTDAKNVAAARRHIRSLELYGPVSAEVFDGRHMPYTDNTLNLVVSADLGAVPMDEVRRALAPNGVAYIRREGRWSKTVKPRPKEMDQWTHYLYDATNNAVSQDSLIEPLSRYQWVGGMRYSRHHDHMSSVSAVVSAGGRVFYIMDEAPRASILTPPEWKLIARDAFNGTLLWKRDVDPWHDHLWPLKSGPQILARRLVAVGDRVYATLSIDGPLTALDAATGETVRTYQGTKATEEILCDDGVLLLSVAAGGQPPRSDPKKTKVHSDLWAVAPRTLMAVRADTGKVLWKKRSPVASLSLAADGRRVMFHDGKRIQCLNRATGRVRWTSNPLPIRMPMRSSLAATLIIHDDVVLYSGKVAAEKYLDRDPKTTIAFALSAATGKTLWKAPLAPCGHATPDDLLVAGGLVWHGAVARGEDSGAMVGRDLHTGEVKSRFTPDVNTYWFHHRCYRAKATDKYLLFSRTGIEFIDHAREHWICHHWVRGACHYGIMPANGLIYAPQHPCACYLEAKLFGFSALAPPSRHGKPPRNAPEEGRLMRGPAYGEIGNTKSESGDEASWPTFRHDAARSGATAARVAPVGLKRSWKTTLGGRLSSPVVAEGKLFVATVDTHTVHALDAATGKPAWRYTAGGRVDSPPTLWNGLALFGSADGCVYAVRAADGQLVWRYRAAPADRRMGAFGQLESVWPVHGSVLVLNDTLYCVAGRSMFLDGGLRLLRLDPKTGRKRSETVLNDRDPETGKNLQVHVKVLDMPVALPDILSSDGTYVYMRSLPFTLEGKRKFVTHVNVKQQEGDDRHLFCPTGFLDDSFWHRSYWVYGRAFASGCGGYFRAGRLTPAGRLLAFDAKRVYGYGRLSQYYRWTTPLEYRLFAAEKQPEAVPLDTDRKKKGRRTARSRPRTGFASAWSNEVSVQVTAMVLAADVLFAAGPPDLEDEEASSKSLNDSETQRRLAEQDAAFRGRRGGLLVAVSPDDGRRLAAYRLESMPRFDGLIAAAGRLYLSTADGKVMCLGAETGTLLPEAPGVHVAAIRKNTSGR